MGFKENLKRLREAAEMTQAAAAQAAGVAFRSYQNWEAGVREPRLEALKRLAEAFGVSADVLLQGVEQPPEETKKKKAPAKKPATRSTRRK